MAETPLKASRLLKIQATHAIIGHTDVNERIKCKMHRDHELRPHTHTATPPQAYPYRYVKQHQLTTEDVKLLSRPFPFITEKVTSKLMAEKDEYHIAASSFQR